MPYVFILIGINLYWGLTQVFIKHALAFMSSSMYATLRFASAAIILIAVGMMHGLRFEQKTLRDGALLGLLVGGQMLLNTLGLYFTSTTNTVFISQLAVVAVPGICCMRARRVPSFHLVLSTCVVLAGLVVFTGMLTQGLSVGDALACIAMLGSCAQILFGSYAAERNDALSLSLVQMLVATSLSSACALVQGGSAPVWTAESLGIIVLTGAIGSGVCHTLMILVQRCISPSAVSFINVLYPSFAMIGAAIIPDRYGTVEEITVSKLIGGCLMVAGMLAFFTGERLKRREGGKRFLGAVAVRNWAKGRRCARMAGDNHRKGNGGQATSVEGRPPHGREQAVQDLHRGRRIALHAGDFEDARSRARLVPPEPDHPLR